MKKADMKNSKLSLVWRKIGTSVTFFKFCVTSVEYDTILDLFMRDFKWLTQNLIFIFSEILVNMIFIIQRMYATKNTLRKYYIKSMLY